LIQHSFIHIPGIGLKTEQRFWECGIRCWDDFSPDCPIRMSPSKMRTINTSLEASRRHLKAQDPNFFSERLPPNQHWRLFSSFRESTAYLDIETTGLDAWRCEITTVVLYDGKSVQYYVNGRNLDDFTEDISKYKILVTYNGKSFDVPFIEKQFGITLDQAHIDLRYVLASLGYAGGLKRCEYLLGISRGDYLKDIDGYFAVLLWYDYARNSNRKALETLLSYNIQDTVNLETLMVTAYNMRTSHTPFHQDPLPEPVSPLIPYSADMETVDRIKREYGL